MSIYFHPANQNQVMMSFKAKHKQKNIKQLCRIVLSSVRTDAF